MDVGGSILGDVDIERGRADVGVDVDGNVKLDWGGRISVGRDVGGDLTAVDSNVIIERDIEGSLTLLDRSKAVVKGRVHGVVSTDETSQFENALL